MARTVNMEVLEQKISKAVTDSSLSYDEIITLIRSAGKSKAEE